MKNKFMESCVLNKWVLNFPSFKKKERILNSQLKKEVKKFNLHTKRIKRRRKRIFVMPKQSGHMLTDWLTNYGSWSQVGYQSCMLTQFV